MVAAALVGGVAGWLFADGNDERAADVATTALAVTAPVVTSPEATTPERTLPPTTVTTSTTDPPVQAVPIEIGPQDIVELFVGERESDEGGTQLVGFVLAFDASSAANAGAQSIGSMLLLDEGARLPTGRLPDGWEQNVGELSFEGIPRERGALAVVYVWPYVWVVEPDQTMLAAYNAASGQFEASSPISGAVDLIDATGSIVSQTSSTAPGSQSSTTSTSERAQE